MNRRTTFTLLFAGLTLLVGGADAARAQTVAAGPYYAMPAWDQKLACSSPGNCPRFVVLSNWNSEAVLDRETGLVWEREPSGAFDLDGAHLACNDLTSGGRRGWRVPTYQDLSSLVDPTTPLPGPALPAGHPFIGVQGAEYWSATSSGLDTTIGWALNFASGTRRRDLRTQPKLVWCVRGGQGVGVQ